MRYITLFTFGFRPLKDHILGLLYSLNEEEFLEEINNFSYEEFNDLLLEEDDDIFYLTKEVFENFKISFSAND